MTDSMDRPAEGVHTDGISRTHIIPLERCPDDYVEVYSCKQGTVSLEHHHSGPDSYLTELTPTEAITIGEELVQSGRTELRWAEMGGVPVTKLRARRNTLSDAAAILHNSCSRELAKQLDAEAAIINTVIDIITARETREWVTAQRLGPAPSASTRTHT